MQTAGPAFRVRFPLLALGILSLLAAMWGGLVRLGFNLPPLDPVLAGIHGPLMVSGFLGTLISLERAVALRQRWPYAAPLLTVAGAVVLIATAPPWVGALLITLGSLGLVAIFVVIVRRQPALFTFAMALGTVVWFLGNLIWLVGAPVSSVVLWWAGFLILTIVGERLELARLRRSSPASEWLFGLAVTVMLAGFVLDTILAFPPSGAGSTLGIRVAGAGMLGLALWLARYDIARRTVRQSGLTRFVALCLLLGYFWLGLGGLLRLADTGGVFGGPYYDAMLHTVFLGFVMSMIFGHAPIILPAVLGRAMPYHLSFYAHLVLLHLSLALRVVGDLAAGLGLRQWGGVPNVAAILLFLSATAQSLLSASAHSGFRNADEPTEAARLHKPAG